MTGTTIMALRIMPTVALAQAMVVTPAQRTNALLRQMTTVLRPGWPRFRIAKHRLHHMRSIRATPVAYRQITRDPIVLRPLITMIVQQQITPRQTMQQRSTRRLSGLQALAMTSGHNSLRRMRKSSNLTSPRTDVFIGWSCSRQLQRSAPSAR